ncbi:hypothetical protein, partial [Desulfobacter postgatei]|uniref:hypothetical protein n=1 Tax=Desulfobacter postgatei TaxID=2293 RepID=UPI001C113184
MAGMSVINWTAFVFNQLLIADEKIAFVHQMMSVRTLSNFLIVLLTIHFKWSLILMFFIRFNAKYADYCSLLLDEAK